MINAHIQLHHQCRVNYREMYRVKWEKDKGGELRVKKQIRIKYKF